MAELEHSVTIIVTESSDVLEICELPQSVEVYDERTNTIELVEQGRQGIPGAAATLSADANNRTRLGSDGGFMTPDIETDPVAYYILAKS